MVNLTKSIALETLLDIIPNKELVSVKYYVPEGSTFGPLKLLDCFGDSATMACRELLDILYGEHSNWLNADVTEVSIGMECAGDGFYAVEDERPYIDISVVY